MIWLEVYLHDIVMIFRQAIIGVMNIGRTHFNVRGICLCIGTSSNKSGYKYKNYIFQKLDLDLI